jgi:anaerobic selenocysteine-containing dehydrogenase
LRAVENWASWININTDSAARLQIAHRDPVWIESPLGRIKAFALLSDKTPGDMILMTLGKGHTQFGRFAKGKGSNAKLLVAAHTDPLSGLTPGCVSRVRIIKA